MGEGMGVGGEPREAIHDLPALLALRAALARLDPALPPTALVAQPARAEGGAAATAGAAVGILAGSFDPLTNAHGALARAALDARGARPPPPPPPPAPGRKEGREPPRPVR